MLCLAAMMAAGMSLKAQEITITLYPGWNWISYPNAAPMGINEALGAFTPLNGDKIKSQFSNSTYNNGSWRGGVTHFMPGWGYMYYSARTEEVEFVFANAETSDVVVGTLEPTEITAVSATVGSTLTIDEGNHVFARGVCWGTDAMPTVDGSHTSDDAVAGSQSITLTDLTTNTTYYVRAYVVSDYGLAYGNEVSFNTIPIWTIEATPNPTEGGTITGAGDYEQNAVCTLTAIANEGYVFANWTENGEAVSTDATYTFTIEASRTLVANFNLDHTYVDLGLPSGLLWATCNVGADTPDDYGDYFAWGETQPKDNFSWTNYQYCMGSFNTLTKYCNNPDIGYNGFTDDLTTLLPEDDAATANWGDNWRMPTEGEWQELYENTTVTWTTQNGVRGRLFTASNGNSIFLPASGYSNESVPEAAGIIGDYWTSSLDTDYPSGALSFFFNSSNYYIGFCNRLYGRNVRAVRVGVQNNAPTGAINGLFSVSEGQQVYFSQGNLQYQASTNTWRFAENQYDYVGSDNSNISSNYSGWIDLFGWGTSGYNHGANCYQPWSTSQSYSDYYAYGSYTYNLYDQTGQADWGYNAISNGGNTANQWRTLTQPEWYYVFNTRSTTSGIRYAKAQVNNVNGVILLPDDWSSSTYSLSSTNTYTASFSSNSLTASQWSTLEQAGAVFLPAAGVRSGTSVGSVGSNGNYWSASYNNSSSAFNVYFGGSYLGTNGGGRYCGFSVRLVRVAE